MRANNNISQEIKFKLCQRLNDAMENKGISRTEMRQILRDRYDYHISRQTFQKYQDGINWMPRDFMEHISEITNINILEGFE